jgi:hypothetical protein
MVAASVSVETAPAALVAKSEQVRDSGSGGVRRAGRIAAAAIELWGVPREADGFDAGVRELR